jgi:hypothetical protein
MPSERGEIIARTKNTTPAALDCPQVGRPVLPDGGRNGQQH